MGELVGVAVLLLVAFALTIVILTGIVAREMLQPRRHTVGYALARGIATDPGDLGLAFEAWTLERPDGATLPVWEIRGRAEGGRLTAVLVHDWGESRIDLLGALEPWLGRCARVALMDLRGHGEAMGGGSRLGRREVDDLVALLERLGDGPFVLVGRGLGAAIALSAEKRRDDVDAVIVHDARERFGDQLRAHLRDARRPEILATLALAALRVGGIRPLDVSPQDLQRLGQARPAADRGASRTASSDPPTSDRSADAPGRSSA